MLKAVAVLLGLLMILSTFSDRLAAHESLCKRYPREQGQTALAAAHQLFRQREWIYSDRHPTEQANVFHT